MNLKFDCFPDPYIGLYECDKPPYTGLYLSDLEGITLKKISAISSDEASSEIEWLKRVEREAIRQVINDVRRYIGSQYQFEKILWERNIISSKERFDKEFSFTDAGFEIKVSDCDKYKLAKIDYIDIRINKDANKKIHFETECQHFTKDVQLKACENNRQYINFTGRYLKVYYDTCDIEPAINECGCGCDNINNCNCASCCFELKQICCGTWGGMSFTAQCICDMMPLFCTFKDDMANAVRIQIGIKIMLESLLTDKLTNIVNKQSKEKADLWLALYDGQNRDGKYWHEIKNIGMSMKSYLQSQSSDCISCTGIKAISYI